LHAAVAASTPRPEGLLEVRLVATHKIPDNAPIRDRSCSWTEKMAEILSPVFFAAFAAFAMFAIFGLLALSAAASGHG
jgi:hypothetical protein